MPAEIIDGKALAKSVEKQLKADVAKITPLLGRAPGLAVVLVGDDPASQVYVASKSKKAKRCGIEVCDLKLPSSTDNETLQSELRALSARTDVDGILLQLPLPSSLDEFQALSCIAPDKDADGLHPTNQGLLLRGAPAPRPCTPKGCLSLVEEGRRLLGLDNNLQGLHAVVVGRSILVGKPLALMLLDRHCTVSICHSRTRDLAEECRRADVIVAAVGRANIINEEMIKPGAIIIDVGINRLEDGRLVGDVDFEGASKLAGAITPVPGGVGPMTIAMLLSNTVDAAYSLTKNRV